MLDYHSGSNRTQGNNDRFVGRVLSSITQKGCALSLMTAFALSGCMSASQKPEPAQDDTRSGSHPIQDAEVTRTPSDTTHTVPTPSTTDDTQVDLDLHARLVNGFRLDFDTYDHPIIDKYLSWYQKRPEHMKQLCENADLDLHYITELMEQNDMPLELALLPGIESTFKAKAVSRSGAQGLWQIMPRTADHLNLTRNQWYDGRLDIHESTEAAIAYLKEINAQFDGDWLLTLAAYNAGPGAIRRTIRNSSGPANYWALPLRAETRNYVPKLIALARVFKDPEYYGVPKCDIPNWPKIHRVELKYQTDLSVAAKLANMSLDDVVNVNPAINHWMTPPTGPKTLYIHSQNAPKFVLNEQKLSRSQRTVFTKHTIKRGESLSSIARKYGTSTQQIKSFNGLHSSRLIAGKTLKIPTQGQKSLYAKLKASEPKPKNTKKTLYTVRAGDTWWEIARKFGVSHKNLAKWNGKSSKDTLSVGSRLIIWRAV